MMDRLKFRVWNKKKTTYDVPDYASRYLIDEDGDLCISIEYDGESYVNMKDYIVQQCTGLKDKNDNLIYEGDIVENWSGSEPVIWDNEFKVEHDSARFSIMHDDYKVIGNIFENPELLEGK